MSDALSTDMNKVRLLCWFNENKMVAGENKSFRVNSSAGAQNAFLNFVMKKNYFKPGTGSLAQMLGIKMEVAGKK